jgi:hypothetical protein
MKTLPLSRGARYVAVMSRTHVAVAVTSALLAACSPAPMPISTSSRDPSSPTAPEGAHPPHVEPHAQGDAGAETYVCPMHPEVTSTTPGTCPKCKMKLVPKK